MIKKRSHSDEGNWESCLNLLMHKLLEEIRNNSASDARTISNTIRHKEGDRRKHEFLVDCVISEGQCVSVQLDSRLACDPSVLRNLIRAGASVGIPNVNILSMELALIPILMSAPRLR